MRWLQTLELKFGRFAISQLPTYIAGLSLVVFAIQKTINPYFFDILDLRPAAVLHGEIWRLATYLLIPSTGGFFTPDWFNVTFYALFLIWIGNGLEHAWSSFRLNVYCLLSAAGITVAAFFFGANFSHGMFFQALFFAFARYYPDTWIRIMFILPVKVKWLAWLDAASLLMTFFTVPSSRMAIIAALACYLIFFGKEIVIEARLEHATTRRRQKFQRDSREDVPEAMHKCAVCGRTELEAPNLDFRVSRDGEEYCVEHLPRPAAATSEGG